MFDKAPTPTLRGYPVARITYCPEAPIVNNNGAVIGSRRVTMGTAQHWSVYATPCRSPGRPCVPILLNTYLELWAAEQAAASYAAYFKVDVPALEAEPEPDDGLHDYTVIGYYEDNGQIWSTLVRADSPPSAMGEAAKEIGYGVLVACIEGEFIEGRGIDYPGEGVVDLDYFLADDENGED